MSDTWQKSLSIGVGSSLIASIVWWMVTLLIPAITFDYKVLLFVALLGVAMVAASRYYLLTRRLGIIEVRATAKEEAGQRVGEARKSYYWVGATAYYVVCDPRVRDKYLENNKNAEFLFITVNPECEPVVAAQAEWEHCNQRAFLDHIKETRANIERLREMGVRIKWEGHSFTPTFRVIIIDGQKVLVSFYEKDKLGTECEQLQLQADSTLGRWFIQWCDKTRSEATRRAKEASAVNALLTGIPVEELRQALRRLSTDEQSLVLQQLAEEMRERLRPTRSDPGPPVGPCLIQGVDFREYALDLCASWSNSTLVNLYVEPRGSQELGQAGIQLEALLDARLASASRGTWITILGDFGSGKTTFLKKYAAVLAVRFMKAPTKTPLPLLVELGQYPRVGTLEALVLEKLGHYGIVVVWDFVKSLINQGKVILLLDGFDEMSMTVDRASASLNLDKIRSLLAGHNAVAVIASRTHFFRHKEQQQLDPGTVLYVERWNTVDWEQYLQKALGREWQALRDAIQSKRRLVELAQTPLFLDMIVSTKAELLSDTVGTVSLYKMYTDKWIATQQQRAILVPSQKADLLEGLAWQMLQDGKQTISYDELLGILQQRFRFSPTQTDHVDYEIRACSFLIRVRSLDAFAFVHYSFLEYFVSRFLARQIKAGDIDGICKVELSDELIDFLSQHLSDLQDYKQLHTWLEQKDDRAFALARRNAARLLRAMSHTASADFAKRDVSHRTRVCTEKLQAASSKLKERLEAIVGLGWFASSHDLAALRGVIEDPDGKHPRELRMASLVLGLREDRLSVPMLETLLGYKKKSFKIRQGAAVALGVLGDKDSLTSLKNLLEKDGHHEVRRTACWAIEMIDPQGSGDLLARKAQDDPSPEVRQYAVWALARIGGGDSLVLTALETALKDPASEVRLAVLQAVERIGGEKGLQMAELARGDSDQTVRDCAHRVTQRIKERLAV